MKTEYEHILVEINDAVAIVRVNNPKSLNALDIATLNDLSECFDELAVSNLRVLIVTGAGEKAFAAGANIAEMLDENEEEAYAMSRLGQTTFAKLEKMPLVTIAAVNGYALGGGNELAMACDMRIAADNAVFAQPECGLGIIPGWGGTQRLARLIGKPKAKEVILADAKIKADEAYRLGLVNQVVAKEELMDAAMKMANKVIKNSKSAVAIAKKCIDEGYDTDLDSGMELEARGIAKTFATYDKKEGMSAFLEKREPEFEK